MLWLEEDEISRANPTYVVDYAYRIRCHSLPVEHAYSLAEGIAAVLPWYKSEPNVGIHSIHVAESGNGWIRPTGNGNNFNSLLHLSRRTRLILRLPKNLIEKAKHLEGATLDINSNTLVVEKGQEKPLRPSGTVFARYVATGDHDKETRFVDYLVDQLQRMNIHVRKLLCGREHVIPTPKAPIHTRSVLIAEINPEESLLLQQNGIGPFRQLGCGLFIPHKDIAPVVRKK
uniref:CRISPR-associated protein Cas6, subtype MYXAN n=1 Tax=Candidatus Kentrum sp. TC TaxID=2126339 RepID=A0A450YL02_9GAMM|nr:MAG: CRISPR-associated protein Cas6, subtype MYXAN [Candidatus Kentron sp. TC]VFK42660.1 MAG: CRISPR-associated protein Cas6, subtype MYXAN [Candidatus Kentron sp. TC]